MQNDTAAASANHWNELANAEEDRAEWDARIFGPLHSVAPLYLRAAMYRRTAWALALQAETGAVHCATCFEPHRPEHCPLAKKGGR